MTFSRVALWVAFVFVSGCEFSGSCGNNDNLLNTRKGEKVVSEWLEKQGMPTTSVDCPRDIQMEKDQNFICKASMEDADGLVIDIMITQTNEAGDIAMEHGTSILSSESVERTVAGQILDQTGKKVLVDCGLRVRVAVPGKTYTCAVKSEGLDAQSYQMQIHMDDDAGKWSAKKL